MYSLGLFLAKYPNYIITEKRFYDRGNSAGRATHMFLETGLNKFTIIQHPEGETEILDAWLRILKNDGVSIFRLGHFYKYKFLGNLTNIEMNLDDFFVPQPGPYEWDYYLKRLKLQGTFSDDLKNLLKPTRNISNASQTIPTPSNLKEIFMFDKGKGLNKKIFSIANRINIV